MQRSLSLGSWVSVLFVVTVLAFPARAEVVDATWTGATGNWNVSENWDIGYFPNNEDGNNYNIFIDGGDVVTESLVYLNLSGVRIDNLAIDLGDQLRIVDHCGLNIEGSSITNAGVLTLDGLAGPADLFLQGSATVTLDGAGILSLIGPFASVSGATEFDRLINEDNTIHGAGRLGDTHLRLTNRALIDADDDQGSLDVDPGSAGASNTGIMQASNGGTLRLTGTFGNAGGTIQALDASVVELDDATILYGLLTTAGTGLVKPDSYGALVSARNDGTIAVVENTKLGLEDVITNAGTIMLEAGSSDAILEIYNGDVRLVGGGVVTMSDSPGNSIDGVISLDRLINEDNTIRGAGVIGPQSARLKLVNRGTIDASGVESLQIGSDAAFQSTNSGTLQAGASGTLVMHGICTNYEGGTDGVIIAEDGDVELKNCTIQGGRLATVGQGTMRVAGGSKLDRVTNEANVEVLEDAVLTLAGILTNTGSVTLLDHVSGTAPKIYCLGFEVSLVGGGAVVMTDPDNQIYGNYTTTHLVNQDNTIQGHGLILAGVNLTNHGLIDADADEALTVSFNGTGPAAWKVNTGTLQASAGGTLCLEGSFSNAGGTVRALDASVVQLSQAGIARGTLATEGTGVIQVTANSNLTDLTNAGDVEILNGNTLTCYGTIDNSGSITANAQGGSTTLSVAGRQVRLTAGGTVVLVDPSNSDIEGLAVDDRLINEDNIICGAGGIGQSGNLQLTNRGLIDADQSGHTLACQVASPVNSGTMQASNGGVLVLQNSQISNFEGAVGGVIRADGGTVELEQTTVFGGVVDVMGKGVIQLQDAQLDGGLLVNSNQGTVRADNESSLFTDVDNPYGGTIVVDTGSTLKLGEGYTYNNAGRIVITSNATLKLDEFAAVTLTGGGCVRLTATDSRIREWDSGEHLINQDNTLYGAGMIGEGGLALTNHGVIDADVSGQTLAVGSDTYPTVNTGVMQASDGGTLSLGGQFAVITNTGGGIQAHHESFVDLECGRVVGGVLATGGTGAIRSRNVNSTLVGVANTGKVRALNAGSLGIEDTLDNMGRLSLFGAQLRVRNGDATLTGIGHVRLENGSMVADDPNDRLINQGNTIHGSGQIQAALTNLATVCADVGSQQLHLSDEPKINDGCCKAVNEAALYVQTDVSGGGRWVADGGAIRIDSDAVSVTTTGNIHVANNGTLSVSGGSLGGSALVLDGTGNIQVEQNSPVVPTVSLSGSLIFAMTDPNCWGWSDNAVLEMTGGDAQSPTMCCARLEVGGDDQGPSGNYDANFDLAHLRLAENAAVALVDMVDNGNRASGAEALYADALTLETGAVLNLNGLNLYVAAAQIVPGPYGDGQIVDTSLPDAGDLDDDDDVDADDYVLFATAMNGPNQPAGADCADLDFDGDVDLADLDAFCRLFDGP